MLGIHKSLIQIMFKTDFIFFATIFLLATVAAISLVTYKRAFSRACVLFGLAMLALVTAGWFVAARAQQREQKLLEEMLGALAPTYAQELERLDHAAVTNATPADDPHYLELIACQLRWIEANKKMSSIYSLRQDPGRHLKFVVSCEYDADKNGVFNGEREERIPIGTDYSDAGPVMQEAFRRAFNGDSTFTSTPYKDRWGTWMTAMHPMRDKLGKIESILCLDMEAKDWMISLAVARESALIKLGLVGLMALILFSTSNLWMVTQENEARAREAELLEAERGRFESLLNSLSGVVFEADPGSTHFSYLSGHAEPMLGRDSEMLLEDPGLFSRAIHADDKEWIMEARSRAMASGKPYHLEYRWLRPDGQQLWISETGSPTTDASETGSGKKLIRGILLDASSQKQSSEELEEAQAQLVTASRKAGMAEVATGVLHNVGNILNSVNVSSTIIYDQLKRSSVAMLQQLSDLVARQGDALPDYIRNDERGKLIPKFIQELSTQITGEHDMIGQELTGLVANVEHIKEIVLMQQGYARLSGKTEKIDIVALVDHALGINESAFSRHRIRVVKNIQPTPPIFAERGKTLQILVNVIRNAKHALDEGRGHDRELVVSIFAKETSVCIAIKDNGIGISPEVLPRVCTYGFTTREHGHGFGLHSGVVAAADMKGSLSVTSEGLGKGATFTLELPACVDGPMPIPTPTLATS
jgi:signal transduction histidine kinase